MLGTIHIGNQTIHPDGEFYLGSSSRNTYKLVPQISFKKTHQKKEQPKSAESRAVAAVDQPKYGLVGVAILTTIAFLALACLS